MAPLPYQNMVLSIHPNKPMTGFLDELDTNWIGILLRSSSLTKRMRTDGEREMEVGKTASAVHQIQIFPPISDNEKIH